MNLLAMLLSTDYVCIFLEKLGFYQSKDST